MRQRAKYDIFISYRTSENRQKAEHLYTLLDAKYPHQVSYDKETFANGRWDEQILQRIDKCKDVIVLLTPETFAHATEGDSPKYEKWAQMPADQVLSEIEVDASVDILRTEISRALAMKKNIVPVVHVPDGTSFSDWKLPRDIAAITRFEGVLYNDNDPNLMMTSLIPKIARLLKTKKHRMWPMVSIIVLLLATTLFSMWKFMDVKASWQALYECRTQSDFEKLRDCKYPKVNQAALDSLNLFAKLKKGHLYVNVKHTDSVPVFWSPSVSLLQLRTVSGLLENMMFVGTGEFIMGDNEGYDFDGPEHNVLLTNDFYISKYETTKDEWYAIMKDSVIMENPEHPMTDISFDDAQQFVAKLHRLTQLDFSLPTEAEWEYAAKGNLQENYAGGDNPDDVAYWKGNSLDRIHPVGSLTPNSRDLYDMSGNVSEWCLDGEIEPYADQQETNPLHANNTDRRVIRGGNYMSDQDDLRVGHREHYKASGRSDRIGVRLILKKQQQ